MNNKFTRFLDSLLCICETWQARAAGALLLGLFNLFTKSVLAAFLLASIWFLLVLALKKTNVKTWKLLLVAFVLAVLMSIFWPSVNKGVNVPSTKQEQSQKPTSETPRIEKLEIKNSGFENGLYGLEDWQHYESGQIIISSSKMSTDIATPSSVSIIGKPRIMGNVISVQPKVGNNLTNGLVVDCSKDPLSEKYSCLKQEIHGLKEGALYRIRFWMHLYEDAQVKADSLYMALGTPWQIGPNEEGKIFSKNRKNGWNEITLTNHDRKTDYFYLVVNGVTTGVVLDDLSIEEVPQER